MEPEANKQISKSSGLQWTYCGQGWLSSWHTVQSYRLCTEQTGNQSRCVTGQWCTSQSLSSRVQHRSHTDASLTSQWLIFNTVFGTYYFSPSKCKKEEKKILIAVGTCCILKAFHDMYMMNEKKSVHFYPTLLVNKGCRCPFAKQYPRILCVLCLNKNSTRMTESNRKNLYSV